MTTPTITVHEAAPPEPSDWPLLWTASGEPVVEAERVKVIGFQGRAKE